MDINQQTNILKHLSRGLPICEEPYKQLAEQSGITEQALFDFINELVDSNIISRFGMVIDHESVGYNANAIVVWDIPDDEVDHVGALLGLQEKISLCYKRPRQMPDWPYNLFTMVHGKDKPEVISEIHAIVKENKFEKYACDILVSNKTFKHTGSRIDW